MTYTSSIDARSAVVQEALQHVGKDVGGPALARAQRRKTRVQARPGNWSGPFALMVLIDAGLCDWTWRPGVGFCYRLDRIELDDLQAADMVFFDRPPRDEEFIEAEVEEPEDTAADKTTNGLQLKTVRTHGRATAARPPSSDGPHYGIVVDVLPTGDLRIIKGAHQNRVAVLTVSRDVPNAYYSLRPLVAPFEPQPEPSPEASSEETDPMVRAELPDPNAVGSASEATEPLIEDWDSDDQEPTTSPDRPVPPAVDED